DWSSNVCSSDLITPASRDAPLALHYQKSKRPEHLKDVDIAIDFEELNLWHTPQLRQSELGPLDPHLHTRPEQSARPARYAILFAPTHRCTPRTDKPARSQRQLPYAEVCLNCLGLECGPIAMHAAAKSTARA